jgi:hypothetical protein
MSESGPGHKDRVLPVIESELLPGDRGVWAPKSFDEWVARERTTTFLTAWAEQLTHERDLRGYWARRIFYLIAAQVAGAFGLVIAQGLQWIQVAPEVLQILIPAVLTEVFGLGFLVVKYLFSQPLRHSLDTLLEGSRHGPQ